jgi:hypothetical protein
MTGSVWLVLYHLTIFTELLGDLRLPGDLLGDLLGGRMDAEMQEVIRVTHVFAQPLQRSVPGRLHAVYHDSNCGQTTTLRQHHGGEIQTDFMATLLCPVE